MLTISLVHPADREGIRLDARGVSFAFTIVAYMIVSMSPLQGVLVDRFGPRRVVLTSIPLFAASLAALYFTPTNLARLLRALGHRAGRGVGLWPLGYLQAVTPWFDRKLGLALGFANAGIGLGSTFVPMLVIGPMIAHYGWRHALLALAALVLFMSWPIVVLCLREPTAADARRHSSGREESLRHAFQEASVNRLSGTNVAFFMLGLTATSFVSQQVPLLREAGGRPQTAQLQTRSASACFSRASRWVSSSITSSRRV